MRKMTYSAITVYLAALLFLPAWSVFAQTAKIPVTYPGDTKEKIARRDSWVQGAKKEGKIIWWGTLNPAQSKKLITAFNKIYPFIEVEYWRGTGEELASKVEAQDSAGSLSVDICLGSDPIRFITWRKMGLLQPFGDIVMGLGKMDKRMYSKYGDWFVIGSNAITPQYNTKKVSAAEAPKSWEDLLDPKWKGQVGVSTNSIEHWANLALAEGGWGIEKTEDFLKKLKTQDIIWGRGYSATYSLLVAGEFKVSAQGHIYNVLQAQTKGNPPVEWGRVNPVLITGPPITFQKNAQHSNAAKLFIEWLFSPQGLELYEAATGRGAPFPGSGTRLSKVLEGHKLVYRTEETEERMADLGLIDKFSKILGMTQ